MPNPKSTAKARYEHLKTKREPYLRRAREASAYTIPAIYPPEGSNEATDYHAPYQSVGARGVNNLSSKLVLALLPPGNSFMKLEVDPVVIEEAGAEEARTEFETALSKIQRAVGQEFSTNAIRVTAAEALKHLVIGGNVLVQVLPGGGARFHPLTSYVVNRDGEGNVLEIVILENLDRATADERVREALREDMEDSQADESADSPVELYTRIWRDGSKFRVQQEVEQGTVVEGSEGNYPIERTPWLPLRWTKSDGEDYGRSFCDEYIGDLRSLDAIEQGIVDFAAVASWIVYLLNPGGVTDRDQLLEAPSGAVVEGLLQDIDVLQLDKFADFRIVAEVAERKEQRLEQAFLLLSGIQRNAERVTATEIRRLAEALEEGLGGVYSILAEEMVRPLVKRVMHQMTRDDKLPALPDEGINLRIVTGVEALGRNQEVAKWERLLADASQHFGPEAVAQYFKAGDYFYRKGAALGLDLEGTIRTEEEVEQMRERQAQQAVAERMAGPAVSAAAQQQQQETPTEGETQ